MLKFPLALIRGLGTVALLGTIGFSGWKELAPETPAIGVQRKQLADQLIPEIVEDIRRAPRRVRPVVLLHFLNDASDYFTNRLRDVIHERGVLDLAGRTFGERARNALSLRDPDYETTAEAIDQAKRLGARGVLFGRLHVFESWDSGAKIDVEVSLASTENRQSLFSKRYTVSSGSKFTGSPPPTASSTVFPPLQRCLAWLLLVLLLPVFTIGFIRTSVTRDSNATNAFVLGIYTLADTGLAWLMIGATLTSWGSGLVLATAIALAFAYNVRIMTFALKLET